MQGGIRNVIFLGAGASKADNAPLQADLLREYFQTPRSSDRYRTAMDAELGNFFKGFYDIDTATVTKDTSFPTFEEVLGMLELALARDENFRVSGETWDRRRIQECREHVVFLICTVLAEKLAARSWPGRNYHRELIGRLIVTTGTTCFISLNYDLLIDNAISNRGRIPDYGTTFANQIPQTGGAVPLYKLHGSLNWLRCPLCNSLTHTGDVKGASFPPTSRTPCRAVQCKGETVPIVIPPTFFKVMSDYHLQQVWHAAERALVQAERILFCGYSLPDADMHIRYLLKRAEINRGETPEVFIYNNHPHKPERQKEEESARYKRLFRDPSKVHYTQFAFQDLAEKGFKILKK